MALFSPSSQERECYGSMLVSLLAAYGCHKRAPGRPETLTGFLTGEQTDSGTETSAGVRRLSCSETMKR